MLLFGKFYNKKYQDSFDAYNFTLEFDFTSPFTYDMLNDKLPKDRRFNTSGFYHLTIFNGNEVIYSLGNFVSKSFEPIEILQLIDINKNWNLLIDEIVTDNTEPLVNPISDILFSYENFNDNIDVREKYDLYNNPVLDYYYKYLVNHNCLYNHSFKLTWEKIQENLGFEYNLNSDSEKLAKEFVKNELKINIDNL